MKPVPPKIAPAKVPCAGILLTASGLAIITLVFFVNPSTHKIYPICQFHQLTGLNCPGCGSTRALYALVHGKFRDALRDNALFVLILGAFAYRSAEFGLNKFFGRANGEFFPIKFLWIFLFILFVFTILRNLKGFDFLAP